MQIKTTEERAWVNAIRIEIGVSCGLLVMTGITTAIVSWLSKSKMQENEPKVLVPNSLFSVSVIEEWNTTYDKDEIELNVKDIHLYKTT